MKIKSKNLLIVLALLTTSFHYYSHAQNHITYPENEWEMMEDVSDFGWNQEKINQLYRYAIDSTNATGIIVVQSSNLTVVQ